MFNLVTNGEMVPSGLNFYVVFKPEENHKFVFEEYTDAGGTGDERIFNTLEEAVDFYNYSVSYLTEKEKERYKWPASVFRIYSVKLSDKDISSWKEGSYEMPLSELDDGEVNINLFEL